MKRNAVPVRPARSVVALLALVALIASPIASLQVESAYAATSNSCNGEEANDQNDIRVTASNANAFYIDSGQGQNVDAAYAGYKVQNLSGLAGRDNVWVSVDSFTGGVVGLANPADASQPLGDIAANGSDAAFFLLKATTSSTRAQSHVVRVFTGKPGAAGATELYSCTYTFAKVSETIKAAANKVTSLATTSVSTVGSLLTVTVQGNTGTIGAGNALDQAMLLLTPAARSSWPTESLRLERTVFTSWTNQGRNQGQMGPFENQLRVSVGSGSRHYYTAVYEFRVIGPSAVTAADVVPIAQISSGTQTKHTDLKSISDLNSPALTTGAAVVNVAVSKSVAGDVHVDEPGFSTFDYSVQLQNKSAAVIVDDVVDIRDAGLEFVPGSASINGVSVNDPTVESTRSLRFAGPFSLPAGTATEPSERTLTYKMRASLSTCSDTFTYSNSAAASIGELTIGSTDSTISVAAAGGTCGSPTLTTNTSSDEALPLIATTGGAQATTTTAEITGLVDSNGDAGRPITFQYGTSPTLANATVVSAGATTSSGLPESSSSTLTGLATGTLYYYRIVVDSVAGDVAGDIRTFQTAETPSIPTATTTAATGATTEGSVTLNGVIDPNQVTNGAKIKFVYAADGSAGSCSALSGQITTGFVQTELETGTEDAILGGAYPSDVTKELTGLTSGAYYCYKVAAYYNQSTASWSTQVLASNWEPFRVFTRTAQSISFATPASHPALESFAAGASASSGLAVSYSSNSSEVCTVSGSVITTVASGTCSITAAQPGSPSYDPAADVTVTFAVTALSQSITFAPQSSATTGDLVVLSGSTSAAGLDVTYTAGPSAVCSITEEGKLQTGPGEGSCTVTASQPGDSTYLAAADVVAVIAIQPGPPVITTTALDDGTVGTEYDFILAAAGGDGTFTWALTAGTLPAGLAFAGSTGRISGTPTVTGTTPLTFKTSSRGLEATATLNLNVRKLAQVITVANIVRNYGDIPVMAGGSSSNPDGNVTYSAPSDTSVITIADGRITIVGVGSATVTASAVADATYEAAPDVQFTVTVTPAQLTVTAPNPTIAYSGTLPALVPLVTGYVRDEDASALRAAPLCSSAYSTTSDAGSAPLVTCSGASAANYTVTYVDGVVTITKLPQVISVSRTPLDAMPPSSTTTFTATALGGRTVDVVASGDCTWSAGVITFSATEGNCTITSSAVASTNYEAAVDVVRSAAVSFSARRSRSLTFVLDQPGTEHAMTESLTTSTTLGPVAGTITYAVDPRSRSVCSLDARNSIVLLGPGSCSITASVAGSVEYSPASATATFQVVHAPRTLSLAATAVRTTVGSAMSLNATPSAGAGTISYSLVTGASHCNLAGSLVTGLTTGFCDVQASVNTDGKYATATSVTLRLEVVAEVTPAAESSVPMSYAPGGSIGPMTPQPATSATPLLHVVPTTRLPAPENAPLAATSRASRSLSSLASERFSGFAPGSGIVIRVTGARTAAQFAVAPANAIGGASIDASITESRARLKAGFASVDSGVSIDPTKLSDVLGGETTDDAAAVFAAAGLARPITAGQLDVASSMAWVLVSAHVEGYEPGSVVYLAVTTSPVIFAAAVVDKSGNAEFAGLLPADLLENGGHDIRIVGTRLMSGISVDSDGSVILSDATMAEILRFDVGTQATVLVSGTGLAGAELTAVRIVPLLPDAPWWTVWVLAVLGALAAANLAVFRPASRRWSVIASALVAVVAMLPLLVGWISRAYDVVAWGIGLAIAVQLAIWVLRRFHRSPMDGERDLEPWMRGAGQRLP